MSAGIRDEKVAVFKDMDLRTIDFENFKRTPEEMVFSSKHEMPIIKGILLKHPEKLDFIGFNYCGSTPQVERKNKSVHFFIYDYLFDRCWNRVSDNTKLLQQFKFVMTPDFSEYTDMSITFCMWQHFRKQWLGAYWQLQGIPVIPTACWSTKESYKFAFEGMPKNACIATSSQGWTCAERAIAKNSSIDLSRGATKTAFREGTEVMMDELTPKQLIWYGQVFNWTQDLCDQYDCQLIAIDADYKKRFAKFKGNS